jgi:UDP-N-acetylmuramate dehydrogenase
MILKSIISLSLSLYNLRAMIRIHDDFSMKGLNTLGIDAYSRIYVYTDSFEDLNEYIKKDLPQKRLIIGGGSNLLFRGNFHGTVIHPDIKGIKEISKDDLHVELEVGCGENWDSFVKYCCDKNYGGIENLSLIPGTVGSAPVQNIGAYGVEIKDRVLWVMGIDLTSGDTQKIYHKDCNFEYRNSIFKQELKNKFIVTSVAFRLDVHPRFELGYGNVESLFKEKKQQTIHELRNTIIEIRKSKLPDPVTCGNAGSFFKNPIISIDQFSNLKNNYPSIPSYPAGDMIKIPAAWLIEKSGWKGVREGDTGTWPLQPLVIVNYGNASGEEVFLFSEKIKNAVESQFGIALEREVEVL